MYHSAVASALLAPGILGVGLHPAQQGGQDLRRRRLDVAGVGADLLGQRGQVEVAEDLLHRVVAHAATLLLALCREDT